VVGDCFVAVKLLLAMTGQRQIDATDRAIDRLGYDLYGLTEGGWGVGAGEPGNSACAEQE
jgi:hypothetical protein